MIRIVRFLPLLVVLALPLRGAELLRVMIESGGQPFSFLDARGRPDGFAVALSGKSPRTRA